MPTFRTPLAAASALILAACAAPDAATTDAAAPATATPSVSDPAPEVAATAASAPATVDNCGTEVPVGESPERIVAIKSSAAELLLALGLEDRIVGAAFLDGPLAPRAGDAGHEVPIVSDGLPGQEAVLSLEPDAIFAGWESNLSVDGAGERPQLEGLGILTYVAPSACKDAEHQPHPMTFPLLMDHVREAGLVFGAETEAQELAVDLEDQLAAIAPDARGLSALWYSSGSDTPYVGAGIGAPQMVMEAAGLANIVGDVEDTWTSASWEAVAAEDPDVIVLVDAAWNTADDKIAVLEDNPATAQLSAVQQSNYVVVPFAASEAGVRSVDAVASIVDQLGAIEVED
ncbi:putative F420-0 ABC transporter substrate-binding protein [Demequina sp. NBRC 110056]|uniref:putative F420-0 ABC transporter substrate-binding protein n=1 Tax=Demequina sp. NBRC 110056 TaxID=1570345 RepID=UPI000A047EA0|nr:putative F420-0 ABC transporter substrate-binding protein [Demequina sp. NBRC 110056]